MSTSIRPNALPDFCGASTHSITGALPRPGAGASVKCTGHAQLCKQVEISLEDIYANYIFQGLKLVILYESNLRDYRVSKKQLLEFLELKLTLKTPNHM